MRLPPPLAAGARVALIAPSGPLLSSSAIDVALEQARSFGWDPMVGEHATARDGYLAGDDASRLHDLNAALRDDTIDGIWCLRGGYGAMRLLPLLDVDAMRRRPRVLIGYSDITALHAVIGGASEVVTYHGPHAGTRLSPFSRTSMEHAVVAQRESCGQAPDRKSTRLNSSHG